MRNSLCQHIYSAHPIQCGSISSRYIFMYVCTVFRLLICILLEYSIGDVYKDTIFQGVGGNDGNSSLSTCLKLFSLHVDVGARLQQQSRGCRMILCHPRQVGHRGQRGCRSPSTALLASSTFSCREAASFSRPRA